MDNRPIGVFDSGLGGLTAVRQLLRIMPDQPIVFFGDTARLPYGSRSREAIIRYARQDISFLRTFDIKLIVAACGTVSTTALDDIVPDADVPIIGVVRPSARKAASLSRGGRIGVIGTAATIRSGAYERALLEISPSLSVTSIACPLFVPLVENGRYDPGDIVVKTIVSEYLAPLAEKNVDTLILGCTHYPLLYDAISGFLGPDVALVDSGSACAGDVMEHLAAADMLCGSGGGRGCSFYVSDSVDNFSSLASIFLGWDVSSKVQQVDITSY
ncbi:MAG: glutamate racemase [Oscillospiraceae bacterium]|nr:glutamate racemase [Oscillospiraceae bacterium]